MSDGAKVYMVTSDDHDGMTVAVFSTRERAEAACPKDAAEDGFVVREIPVDVWEGQPLRRCWQAEVMLDGSDPPTIRSYYRITTSTDMAWYWPSGRKFFGNSFASPDETVRLALAERDRWRAAQAKSEGGPT